MLRELWWGPGRGDARPEREKDQPGKSMKQVKTTTAPVPVLAGREAPVLSFREGVQGRAPLQRLGRTAPSGHQGAALRAVHVAEVAASGGRRSQACHSGRPGAGHSELSPSGPLSGVGGRRGLLRERLTRRGGNSSLRFSTAATVSRLSTVGSQ